MCVSSVYKFERADPYGLRHLPLYAGVSEVRSPSGFGIRDSRKIILHFKQNPTISRSFGAKFDDFKISEVGERLFIRYSDENKTFF